MPALTARIGAIHIQIPNEWLYNIVELQQRDDLQMYTISALEEVPRIIFNHVHQAGQQQPTL